MWFVDLCLSCPYIGYREEEPCQRTKERLNIIHVEVVLLYLPKILNNTESTKCLEEPMGSLYRQWPLS